MFAEFLDLTIEDVDRCIELVFTPVRNDGVRGSPKTIISNVIAPGKLIITLPGNGSFEN